jgi:predicted nuclease of predicted toxin-antitoxin system
LRFLADENVPQPVTAALRGAGHDVLAAGETMHGAADQAILETAASEGRILLTFDKGFGELALQHRLTAGCGVVLFRLGGRQPEQDNDRILGVLASRSDWAGHFAVVTDDRVRLRRLPLP